MLPGALHEPLPVPLWRVEARRFRGWVWAHRSLSLLSRWSRRLCAAVGERPTPSALSVGPLLEPWERAYGACHKRCLAIEFDGGCLSVRTHSPNTGLACYRIRLRAAGIGLWLHPLAGVQRGVSFCPVPQAQFSSSMLASFLFDSFQLLSQLFSSEY